MVQCHSRAARVLPKHLAPRPSPGPYASSALHSDSRYAHTQPSPPGQGRVRAARDVRPFAPPGVRLGSGNQGNGKRSGSKTTRCRSQALGTFVSRRLMEAPEKWPPTKVGARSRGCDRLDLEGLSTTPIKHSKWRFSGGYDCRSNRNATKQQVRVCLVARISTILAKWSRIICERSLFGCLHGWMQPA